MTDPTSWSRNHFVGFIPTVIDERIIAVGSVAVAADDTSADAVDDEGAIEFDFMVHCNLTQALAVILKGEQFVFDLQHDIKEKAMFNFY